MRQPSESVHCADRVRGQWKRDRRLVRSDGRLTGSPRPATDLAVVPGCGHGRFRGRARHDTHASRHQHRWRRCPGSQRSHPLCNPGRSTPRLGGHRYPRRLQRVDVPRAVQGGQRHVRARAAHGARHRVPRRHGAGQHESWQPVPLSRRAARRQLHLRRPHRAPRRRCSARPGSTPSSRSVATARWPSANGCTRPACV